MHVYDKEFSQGKYHYDSRAVEREIVIIHSSASLYSI